MKEEKIKILKNRICAVCGKKFDVKLSKGKDGKWHIPKEFWYKEGLGYSLTGKNIEYWECSKCANRV